jgi:hypothetical protein
VSAFFEFTGKKYPKAKRRFALRGSPMTAIAGLCREPQGNHPSNNANDGAGPDEHRITAGKSLLLTPMTGSAGWANETQSRLAVTFPSDRSTLRRRAREAIDCWLPRRGSTFWAACTYSRTNRLFGPRRWCAHPSLLIANVYGDLQKDHYSDMSNNYTIVW